MDNLKQQNMFIPKQQRVAWREMLWMLSFVVCVGMGERTQKLHGWDVQGENVNTGCMLFVWAFR